MPSTISVVIPVHNEEAVLGLLFKRLLPVMQSLPHAFEIVLVNDGSTDSSESVLDAFHAQYPDVIRVLHFNGNFGQHMAIMAGFEIARGDIVVTLDADLQNPPEEIPKLIELALQGHDVVGGFRLDRQDKPWRLFVSKWHNRLREMIAPHLKMKDEGCMLRAYSKDIVQAMVRSQEASTFIPALAMLYAKNPIDIGVKHEARTAGETSYGLYKLIRYNFDLITNFSLVPLQIFTLIGMVVSLLSTGFVGFLFVRRIVVGPEAEGVFTLFAILFLLMGLVLMGLGIVGEYIGRIYQQVREHPRYIVRRASDTQAKVVSFNKAVNDE